MQRILVCLLSGLIAITLAVASSAQEQSTSSKPWLQFKQAKSMKDVEGLKSGDQIALVCPMCKTVTLAEVSGSKEHLRGLKQAAGEISYPCKTCGKEGFVCIPKKEK